MCQDDSLDVESRIAACSTLTEIRTDEEVYIVAHRERGHLYVETGEYRMAIMDFTTVIAMESSDLDAWIARGEAKLAIDLHELARQDFRHVLRVDPENAAAREGCADALVALDMEDQIDSALAHACAIVQSYRREAPSDTVETSQSADAQPATPAVRREFGDKVMAILAQLQAARADADWLRAAALYASATAIDSVAVLCRWQASGGFDGYLLRQYDMMLRPEAYERRPRTPGDVQSLLAGSAGDPVVLRERGLLFAESGAGFAAIDDLDAALQADPDSVELLVLSTKARLAVLNDFSYLDRFPYEARSYFAPDLMLHNIERAMELGADDLITNLAYAETIAWQKNYSDDPELLERARTAYDRTIELLPTWPEHPLKHFLASRLYLKRALIFFSLGDDERFSEDMGHVANPPGIDDSLWHEACYEP